VKGVAEFILTVLYYSDGQYTPEDIENLLVIINEYSDDKPDLKIVNLPMDVELMYADFVKKEDFREDIREIKSMLSGIFNKLDNKEDKK